MKISVPYYMKDVTNQNLLVLAWLMQTLGKTYPSSKSKLKNNRSYIEFGFHPSDIRTILQFKGNAHTLLEKEHGISKELAIGEYSGSETIVKLRATLKKHECTITDQKAIELMCYLSGCLNRNLLEPDLPPVKYFNLDRTIREWFYYKQTSNVLKRDEA